MSKIMLGCIIIGLIILVATMIQWLGFMDTMLVIASQALLAAIIIVHSRSRSF